MIGSLFSGLSGLRSHQSEMDVIGSNVANINTIAYKKARASFEQALVMTIRNGVNPEEAKGGLNPVQIGTGSSVGGIDTLFNQGVLQSTGKVTDLAIMGDGFFIVSNGDETYYTRAGDFQFDYNGKLTTRNGYMVQGWSADVDGKIIKDTTIGDISLPYGRRIPAKATTEVAISGNIDARLESTDDPYVISTQVYDSEGDAHTLSLSFSKSSENKWVWSASLDGDETIVSGGSGTVTFNADGSPSEFLVGGSSDGSLVIDPGNGADQMTISLDIGDIDGFEGLTQHATSSTAFVSSQNGYSAGTLESISIQEEGKILGTFSNGVTKTLAQIAIATFSNMAGLIRLDKNMYQSNGNSGEPFIGAAGESIQVSIASGALEQSNVDLATEFTQLIMAQRGFQANSRMITTANDILEDMVNLKR